MGNYFCKRKRTKPNRPSFVDVSVGNSLKQLDLHDLKHIEAQTEIRLFISKLLEDDVEGLVVTGNTPQMRGLLFEECRASGIYPHYPLTGANNYGSFIVRKEALSFFGLLTEEEQERLGGEYVSH